jgi:hypothetical protein
MLKMSNHIDKDEKFLKDSSSTPGALFGAFATAFITGASSLVTGMLYLPFLVAYKINHRNDPKPVHRGTVRPMRPIKETDTRQK